MRSIGRSGAPCTGGPIAAGNPTPCSPRVAQEVAYETVVLAALRDGYRSLELRSSSRGTKIELCALLVHIKQGGLPWAPPREAPLVFGVPLDAATLTCVGGPLADNKATSEGEDGGDGSDGGGGARVPTALAVLWDELRSRGAHEDKEGGAADAGCTFTEGLFTEGLFRLSAPTGEVEAARRAMESGRDRTAALATAGSHVLAALIKLYLRSLPDDQWKPVRHKLAEVVGADDALQRHGGREAQRGAQGVGPTDGGASDGSGAVGPSVAQRLLYELEPLAAATVVWVYARSSRMQGCPANASCVHARRPPTCRAPLAPRAPTWTCFPSHTRRRRRCDVMCAVTRHAAHNRMGVDAVSVVFAPGLVHAPEGCEEMQEVLHWSQVGVKLTVMLLRAHMVSPLNPHKPDDLAEAEAARLAAEAEAARKAAEEAEAARLAAETTAARLAAEAVAEAARLTAEAEAARLRLAAEEALLAAEAEAARLAAEEEAARLAAEEEEEAARLAAEAEAARLAAEAEAARLAAEAEAAAAKAAAEAEAAASARPPLRKKWSVKIRAVKLTQR